MKRSALVAILLSPLVWGPLGFYLGSRSIRQDSAAKDRPAVLLSPDRGSSPAVVRNPGSAGSSLLTAELVRLLGEGPVPDALMHETTMRVLSEPDPARRTAGIALLVEGMTPSNAAAIKQAFADITSKTGRRHDSEWVLMLKGYGRTLGRQAVEEMKDHPKELGFALEGWAIADPEAARLWLDPADPHYAQRRVSVLNGIALSRPALAFQIAMAEPDHPVNSGWLVECAIQSGGMDGATAALQEALDAAGPGVEENGVFVKLFNELTDSMFFQTWTSGQSEKMFSWLEAQKDQPFVTPDMVDHGVMDAILQGKLTAALDWMDRMKDGEGGEKTGAGGLESGLRGQIGALVQADPATLERIIAHYPPNHGTLLELARLVEPQHPGHAARLLSAYSGAR